MPVGASSIKRAAKTAAAEGQKESGREGKATENAENVGESGKTAKAPGKTPQKKRVAKDVEGKTPRKASGKAKQADSAAAGQESDARQAYEAYGIGQQLPIYLL